MPTAPVSACLCAAIAPIALRTRVALVAHHTEWGRSSNTGRLLVRALPGTRVRLRGARDEAVAEPLESARRLVLYPSDDARELRPADACRELVLVVPEGSWAQTRRAIRREPWLADAEHVRLPPGPPSRYRLRHAPNDEGLSTFEAVARALGILEGEAVARALMATFDVFVERSLAVRGRRSL